MQSCCLFFLLALRDIVAVIVARASSETAVNNLAIVIQVLAPELHKLTLTFRMPLPAVPADALEIHQEITVLNLDTVLNFRGCERYTA